MTKTLVFPIHAFAHEKMVEAAESGVMPTLKGLMEDGCHGVCKSVFSTASPVDYTSMLTGVTPHNHGVVDFQTGTLEGSPFWHDPGEEGPTVIPPEELEQTRLYTSYDVDVPWVWELLEDQKTMQFGIFSPTTYPAPELPNGGVWVSGFWNKPSSYLRDNVAACNDQDVRVELLELEPDYQVSPLFVIPPLYPDDETVDSELAYLRAVLANNIAQSTKLQEARLALCERHDWDIFVTEDGICDDTQHLLWPRSEDNPAHDPDVDGPLKEEGLLDEFYRHLDEMLSRYIAAAPDDVNVVVISVHGQHETTEDRYMHEEFRNLYKYDIWDAPDGWSYREEKPDWSPPTRAEHDFDGTYVVSGPGFASEGASDPISCMDFAPMMLALYGKEVPPHMDGRVPEHVMHDD